MNTEIKTALFKIANAAIDMKEDKLNGEQYIETAITALMGVKNLTIPIVMKSVCLYGTYCDMMNEDKSCNSAMFCKHEKQTVL